MARIDRQLMRAKLKKEHKKMMKTLPRNQRISFSAMYQQAKRAGAEVAPGDDPTVKQGGVAEDFDMSGLEGILVDAEENDEVTNSE